MTFSTDTAEWVIRTDAADGDVVEVDRYDRGGLLSAHTRADGTMLLEGYAAREGIAEYRINGKLVRELVRADTLKASANGLARTVVTLNHPDGKKHKNWVTPDNTAELQVGDTDGEVVMDGGFVKVKFAVRRRDALDAVAKKTHRELSSGYRARIDYTGGADVAFAYPGNPEGRWDQEQTARSYNHLAIVDNARWGHDIAYRADSGVATTVIGSPAAPVVRGAKMNQRLLMLIATMGCTQRFDSDDAALEWLADRERTSRLDSATADRTRADELAAVVNERDANKRRADAAEASAAAEKKRADDAVSSLATLQAAEKTRVDSAERADLEALAKPLKVDGKGLDNKALKRAVCVAALKLDKRELRADADDAYLTVVLDQVRDGAARQDEGRVAGERVWTDPPVLRKDRDDKPARPVSTMRSRWSGKPVSRDGGN